MELVLVRSGETCWDYPDNRLLRVSGGHGVVFPPNHQHRIVNGVYTPCQMLWIEFRSRAEALREARLFPAEELSTLYDLVAQPSSPVRLIGTLMHNLTALSSLLAADDV